MLPVFSSSIEVVTAADIEALCKEQYPEGNTAEFKERIPGKDGAEDPWYSGGNVKPFGRDKILEEVIAFANAHGGHLILGICESGDHPKRAVEIEPVPRCAALAETVRMHIRDCIDPQIPIIQVRGIPVSEDGSGVLLIRVPESPLAPHRLSSSKECFVRHANRTESMSMREIQDLTIERMHKTDRLNEVFAMRNTRFKKWIADATKGGFHAIGLRVTLAPTSDLYANDIFQNHQLFPDSHYFHISFDNGSATQVFVPFHPSLERPIVRGARREDNRTDARYYEEVTCSGIVEISLLSILPLAKELHLFSSWILGAVCNGMLIANAFRCGVGAPDVTYELELEVAATTELVPITTFDRYPITRLLGSPESPFVFPRVSVGPGTQVFNNIVSLTIRDIWNSCGKPFPLKVTGLSWSMSEFTT